MILTIFFIIVFSLVSCSFQKQEYKGYDTQEESIFSAINAGSMPEQNVSFSAEKELLYERKNNSLNISFSPNFFNGIIVDKPSLSIPWNSNTINGIKFGYNFTIPDSAQGSIIATNFNEIVFQVKSNKILEPTSTGFRYLERVVKDSSFLSHNEYVQVDFSDLYNVLSFEENITNRSGGVVLTRRVPVPATFTINNSIGIVRFNLSKLSFVRGQFLYLDPTITINNVQNYTSTKANITTDLYPSAHVTTNASQLVLYLPFDVNYTGNNVNTTYDYSTKMNNGTAQNGVEFSSTIGAVGGAFNFGGSDDNVIILAPVTSSLHNMSNFSIAMWFNASALSGDNSDQGTLFHKGVGTMGSHVRGIWLGYGGSGNANMRFSIAYGSGPMYVRSGNDFALNVTHHIVVTWDGTNSEGMHMYKNGVEIVYDTKVNATGDRLESQSDAYIGVSDATAADFKGMIDEVSVFNRTLSAIEAKALYNGTFTRYAGPPSTQRFDNIDIGQDGKLVNLNVTMNTTIPNSSNMSVMILEYNSTNSNTINSSLIYIVSGDSKSFNTSISSGTYNISFLVNFSTGTYNFQSPTLKDSIIISSFGAPSAVLWSLNKTDGTTAGTNILHSVLWNDTSVNLSGYTFYFSNGSNTSSIRTSGDKEAGIQVFVGLPGVDTEKRYNFSDTTNNLAYNGTNGTGGAQPLAWLAGFNGGTVANSACYTNMTTSDNTYCSLRSTVTDTELYFCFNYTLAENVNDVNWIAMTIEGRKNSSGAGEDCAVVYANNSAGAWQILGTDLGAEASVTLNISGGVISNIINSTNNKLFTGVQSANSDNGEGCDIDFAQVRVGYDSPLLEQDTSYITYSDIMNLSYQESAVNITVNVNVTVYNTTQSATNNNTNATVGVELYNGTTWIDIGNLTITGTGIFSIMTTNNTILRTWNNTANTDIRIRGRGMDWNSSVKLDNLSVSGIDVTVGINAVYAIDSFALFQSVNCTIPLLTCYSNVTKFVNTTVGALIQWYVWANDTNGMTNTSAYFNYTTTAQAAGGNAPENISTQILFTDNSKLSFTGNSQLVFVK